MRVWVGKQGSIIKVRSNNYSLDIYYHIDHRTTITYPNFTEITNVDGSFYYILPHTRSESRSQEEGISGRSEHLVEANGLKERMSDSTAAQSMGQEE